MSEHTFEFYKEDTDKEDIDKVDIKSCKRQVLKWYIKDDNSLAKKFENFKHITKESYMEYIGKKLGSLCEVALCVGWILGSGDPKKLKKLKKTAHSFACFYKVSQDFINIEESIRNSNNTSNISTNYILNFGLQDGYEFFMDSKRKFIEDAMTFDIYTSTIKEIVNYLEAKVDIIIDETSPDLKSNSNHSNNS